MLYGRVNLGGGSTDKGIAPNNITNLKLKVGNTKLTLFWNDPDDTIVDGILLSQWQGTKIVYKQGGYPKNENDGTVAVDSQVRNQYATNGFEIKGLNNGTTYYFQAFPYSSKKAVNTNADNRIEGTPQTYRKMTAIIDLTDSNPDTCISYADDATDMKADSTDWDDFFGYYPCILKDGVEVGKLNKNDFTKFEDGTPADITSGDAGDVMIAYPIHGLTISTIDDKVHISMTDDPNNSEFEYMAHKRGNTLKDVFYLGVYKGYKDRNNKLRSLSDKTPTVSKTLGTFRTYAQNNGKPDGKGGSGYDQSGFYQLTYRQCVYILTHKTLNSQAKSGMGCVNSSSSISTGGTETWGMHSELIRQTNLTYLTDGKHHCKEDGIEDYWGNIYEWIEGLYNNSSRHIMTATENFNDNATGYTDRGQGSSSNLDDYISKPQGGTHTGFIPKEVNGSTTTYFCDFAILYASSFAAFGGSWAYGAYAGAFYLYVDYSASNSGSGLGARLMFL